MPLDIPPAAVRFGWSVVVITVASVVVTAGAGPDSGSHQHVGLAFAWLLFAGSSVHVSATLALFSFPEIRAYARRRPARYLLAPVALLTTAVVTSLVLPIRGLSVALLAFFAWQLWHYQKQNLGLASLAAASARLPSLGLVERRCILGSGIGGILALIARPDVLQIVTVRLPVPIATATFALALLVLGISIATSVVAVIRRRASATAAPAALAVYLVAVAFPVPLVVARSPYAAIGGLTLAHGLQYLLLVGHVVLGPSGQSATPRGAARIVATSAVVVAAAGGLAATSHLHDHTQLAARALFGVYLAVVMAHFVVDAGLWRLRDAFPRRWLGERIPDLLGVSRPTMHRQTE
ncbi:MAG: hypothetical protein ACRDTP_05835 [Mycobacteriales bacterium]